MFPVRYELGSYIQEGGIPHTHRRENLKSYMALTGWGLQGRRNVFPVRYELGFICQKTAFFIVTSVNHQIFHILYWLLTETEASIWLIQKPNIDLLSRLISVLVQIISFTATL
jgi:hypothetical protein